MSDPQQVRSRRKPVEILQSIIKLYKELHNVDFEQYFCPPLAEEDITTEMREIIPDYMLDIYRWHDGYDQNSAPLHCYYYIIEGEFTYNILSAGLSLNRLYERRESDEYEGGTWRKDIITIFGNCADLQLGLNTTTGKIAPIPDSWSFPRVEDIEPEDWMDFTTFLEENETHLKLGKVVMTWDGGKLKEVVDNELKKGSEAIEPQVEQGQENVEERERKEIPEQVNDTEEGECHE